MDNENQNYRSFPTEWLGAWESVNGNPDMYIFQGYDSNYYLLTYSYDVECLRGSFSCYDVYSDENGWYIRMGMKYNRLSPEKFPFGLYVAGLGSYMKN